MVSFEVVVLAHCAVFDLLLSRASPSNNSQALTHPCPRSHHSSRPEQVSFPMIPEKHRRRIMEFQELSTIMTDVQQLEQVGLSREQIARLVRVRALYQQEALRQSTLENKRQAFVRWLYLLPLLRTEVSPGVETAPRPAGAQGCSPSAISPRRCCICVYHSSTRLTSRLSWWCCIRANACCPRVSACSPRASCS